MSGPGLCQQVETFTFERTRDKDAIRAIVAHGLLWGAMSDDFAPETPAAWDPPDPEACLYLLVKQQDELLGLWMFVPQNKVCFDAHVGYLPAAYGTRARVAARACFEWIFLHTSAQRITAGVPEYNRLALKFAREIGMTDYGFNPASYQKEGRLWGQHLLGVSKGE